MTRRVTLIRLALGLGLGAALAVGGGCKELPWGSGRLAEELPATDVDRAGLVVTIGPEDLARAAAEADEALAGTWAAGIAIDGQIPLPSDAAEPVSVTWADLYLEPQGLDMALSEDGISVTLPLTVKTAPLALRDAFGALCAPSLELTDAELHLALELEGDKLGRVQLIPSAKPELTYEGGVDWGACEAPAATLATWTDALVDAIAERAGAVVSADLLGIMPEALGLDASLALASPVARDASGAGYLRASVSALSSERQPSWTYASGHLIVPFTVGIAAEHHPCMQALPLEPVVGGPLPAPSAEDPGATYVSVEVVRRALAALWLAGGACGPHGAWDATVATRDLDAAWPALAKLGGDAGVGLTMWPRELPRLSLAVSGDATITVATGPVDVDLYGTVEGAGLRLASMTLDAELDLDLAVDEEGRVVVGVSAVRVTGEGGAGGFLGAPPSEAAGVLLAPLVERVVAGLALPRLPARAGAGELTKLVVAGRYFAIPR
ncbi:MAG: hypothetical protein H6745_18850 [Deltaproteobacteria bacterium]|nr:hypothetical protein [Deltaproteobacteria bacterium]